MSNDKIVKVPWNIWKSQKVPAKTVIPIIYMSIEKYWTDPDLEIYGKSYWKLHNHWNPLFSFQSDESFRDLSIT